MTPDGRTLYVADNGGTVTPVNVATGTPGTPIKVRPGPVALAVTPDGRTLYVASDGDAGQSGTVLPVTVATGATGTSIPVGMSPWPWW
jgi:DNA-binding beta-propeller fold protein YncE